MLSLFCFRLLLYICPIDLQTRYDIVGKRKGLEIAVNECTLPLQTPLELGTEFPIHHRSNALLRLAKQIDPGEGRLGTLVETTAAGELEGKVSEPDGI